MAMVEVVAVEAPTVVDAVEMAAEEVAAAATEDADLGLV